MEVYVLEIQELASIIIGYCNIVTVKQLLIVNKSLNKFRDDNTLWYNKVQKEFGVIRFKPERLNYFQQYLTLDNITSEKAVKFGRCDQLRVLRRTKVFSCFEVSICAIKYDQPCILEYLETNDKFIIPAQHWYNMKFSIRSSISLYIISKAFNGTNKEYEIILYNIISYYDSTRRNELLRLLITNCRTAVVIWYIKFLENNPNLISHEGTNEILPREINSH